jgi:hypothetical protein
MALDRSRCSTGDLRRVTPLRAFLRHFREAMQRASVSVGGVSFSFDVHRERPEPRIVAGHIVVRRDLANRRDRS